MDIARRVARTLRGKLLPLDTPESLPKNLQQESSPMAYDPGFHLSPGARSFVTADLNDAISLSERIRDDFDFNFKVSRAVVAVSENISAKYFVPDKSVRQITTEA